MPSNLGCHRCCALQPPSTAAAAIIMALAQEFVAWLKSRGGYLHPNLDLFKELPGGDRGVAATEDLAEGAVLLLLPLSSTLYLPTAAELEK